MADPEQQTNYERAFAARPEVYAGWVQLNTALREGMDRRRYELATLAAALRLRSSYCSLAHGKALVDLFDADVAAIARDRHSAALGEAELAVMDFAEKVVDDASAITEADYEPLRRVGLTDLDILDVVLAASARCFFAKVLDGVCALPDADYSDLPDELREALVVGRPIADD